MWIPPPNRIIHSFIQHTVCWGTWGTQTHPCFCGAPRQEKQGIEMRQIQCRQRELSQRKVPITWDSMGGGGQAPSGAQTNGV